MDRKITQFEISWKTFWQILVFAGFVMILYFARDAFVAFLVAAIISIGLDPVVSAMERIRVSRMISTIILFLLVLCLIAVVGYLIVPIIVTEVSGFLGQINNVLASFTGIGISERVISDTESVLREGLSFLTPESFSSITGAIGTVISNGIFFLAMVVIAFYLTTQKEGTSQLLQVLLPDVYEKPVVTVFNRFKAKIRHWFRAQLALSIIIGVVVSIGLWLLGVKYFLILGILAGILEIVPVIGPVVVGAVTFLIALGDSLSLGLYSLLFFFLVQQLENHILLPWIMGKTLNIHPVIVVISMLAGSQIAGLIGILLAVPVAVLAQETFSYLASERKARMGMLNRE